jgi:hypothetical protein
MLADVHVSCFYDKQTFTTFGITNKCLLLHTHVLDDLEEKRNDYRNLIVLRQESKTNLVATSNDFSLKHLICYVHINCPMFKKMYDQERFRKTKI